jgi:chromosome segregation protein
MHIRKLEICGFKSFVDRTVVHFDHDVIGIVGPNGCGKSNIVDAIRWCMGEQSARQLRGKAMEDVIFNGSDTRGPHGMAEVTIFFDNSEPVQASSLPVEYRDYSEIAVTRRLLRDGTSQYLINKVDVRLKDVIDVFLGTGIGTKAYSIVEQGKIGLIVSARAEDRRSLIEEAAGITKYKSRKKAAERKIELTEQNLLRVGDRVGELERNVASLQRQAAKAERYLSYKGELERLMLHAASHQLLEILACEKFTAEQKAEAEIAAQAARTELDSAEAALEVERAEALVLEDAAEKAQNGAFSADNEVRALESEMARHRERLDHLKSRYDAAIAEQADLGGKASALEQERGAIQATLTGLEGEESAQAQSALSEHEKLEALRAGEQAADAVLSELRASASQASSEVAAARAKLAGLERRTAEMQLREGKQGEELNSLSEEREKLASKRDAMIAEVGDLASKRAVADEEKTRLEQLRNELRQAIQASEQALDVERGALAQQRARLRALEEMRERLEGVTDGVKHLMAKADPTLLGLVVDRLQIPPDLTTAVAALLGPMLEGVVVDDPTRAVALLSELSAEKGGRATVVPQTVRRVAGGARAPLEGEGVVCPLVDRLAFAPEDEPLFASLLSDAILVDTAAHALDLAPYAEGRPLVTLDGLVVHPDGSISGGSADPVASELVEEQREMRELREHCAELVANVDDRVREHQELRDRMTEIGICLDAARQHAHEAEIALVSAEKDQKRTDEHLAGVDRRLSAVAAELEEIRQALAEGGHEQADATSAIERGETALAEAEARIEGAALTAATWREQVATQLFIVTEHKVKLARTREQIASALGTVERLGRSAGELKQRIERLDEELVQHAEQTGQTAAALVTTREALHAAITLANEAHAVLARAREVFDAARSALGTREVRIKGLRENVTAATERLAAEVLTLEKLSMKKEHVVLGVRERFRGLDLSRIVGDYHLLPVPDEEHADRVADLTRLLDRMGAVNLEATREHAEEKKRLAFYTEQKADLEKALDDLRQAIAKMNKESKRLFRETFDAINLRFRELFPKMFRGGRAELVLTNPEDLLETGVEIIAQPPGKKLGNIELMSGGEKALTAVSLIFAIFQFKPSPFCILDEVDAPLDEANVTRYNELVREMTDRSQFILITHVKKTMQSVDVLYGVTMQEPGISRLVSVKVNEAAQRRSSIPTTTSHAAVA